MRRQHAYPIRRPNHKRRIGAAATAALMVLVVGAALVWRAPTDTMPGALAAGPDQIIALEPRPPVSSVAALPTTTPAPIPDLSMAGRPGLAPARLATDAWPPPTPAAVSTLTGYVWPLAHPRLTLPFGPTQWGSRVVDGKLFHDGVDLATFCGDRIMATHDGVVLAAGRQFDNFMGWVGSLDAYYQRLDAKQLWFELPIVVVIDDGNGYRSMYAHFWKVTVRPGQRVHAGQLIGYEGMSGHATGCHLHYGLYSPFETATFGIERKVAKDMRLPMLEVARIDPLLVLPYRRGISGPLKPMGS